MNNKQCHRCGTCNDDNSSQCWYCHATLVASEPQAVLNDKKERTTVVFVVLRMHIVSEPLDDLTPDDDGKILGVALDHVKAMLTTLEGLPEDKGHKVVLTLIHSADVVDRR